MPWLAAVERVVFPPQVFVSAGFASKAPKCSVCRSSYGSFDHLVGMPYRGEFCRLVYSTTTATKVSFVDFPADKRCRA